MSLNFDNEDTYNLLLKVCKGHAINPSSSLEAEQFFRELLSRYDGQFDAESITAWLNQRIGEQFLALGESPKWIQEAEWPLADGRPMSFAGQIDWHVQDNDLASKMFHDDTSFYLFIAPKVKPVVVMQQK